MNSKTPHFTPDVVILETRIDNLGMFEVLERAQSMISLNLPGQIITANVDQLVGNRGQPDRQAIYRNAALVVPDGVPLLWAARFLNSPLRERINGTDLMLQICGMAARQGFSVFLFGSPEGTADRAARSLADRFPGLKIAGTYSPDYGFENRPAENEKIRSLLREKKPAVLFVSLGYPKGVTWIEKNQAACGILLAVETGSSFKYVSGELRRAPGWMQQLGLEWLWRLAHEPRRLWKRYLVRDLPFFYHLVRQKISLARTKGK